MNENELAEIIANKSKEIAPYFEGKWPLNEREIKEGDVFAFSYNEAEYQRANEKLWGGALRHCFDRQLVARKRLGELVLSDTYWSDLRDGRTFTIEEARAKGKLTFRFNLADVEPASERDRQYYDDADFFDFSHQHGSYKRFMKRKGAQRSQTKMVAVIKAKIATHQEAIDCATRAIATHQEAIDCATRASATLQADLRRVEDGDLNVYF